MSKHNPSRRVAICLITDEHENVLMGLRDKEKKWSCPGGHLENGEDPFTGCVRELYEEVGAQPENMSLVKVEWKKDRNLLLYLFKIEIKQDQKFTAENDPDKEFSTISYVDPNDIVEELHTPIEDNIALKYWAYN